MKIKLGDELRLYRMLFARQEGCHVGCLYNPHIVKYCQFIHEIDSWLAEMEPDYLCRLTAPTTRHQKSGGQFYEGPHTQISFQRKCYEITRSEGQSWSHDPFAGLGYERPSSGLVLYANKGSLKLQLTGQELLKYGQMFHFGFSIPMDKLSELYPEKGELLP